MLELKKLLDPPLPRKKVENTPLVLNRYTYQFYTIFQIPI